MQKWISGHRGDRKVKAWLREDPPPHEWEGTRMEWAYNSMPQGNKAVVIGGLAILGAGLLWWLTRKPRRAPLLILPEIEGPALRRVARPRYGG